jgi:hypothetical protein
MCLGSTAELVEHSHTLAKPDDAACGVIGPHAVQRDRMYFQLSRIRTFFFASAALSMPPLRFFLDRPASASSRSRGRAPAPIPAPQAAGPQPRVRIDLGGSASAGQGRTTSALGLGSPAATSAPRHGPAPWRICIRTRARPCPICKTEGPARGRTAADEAGTALQAARPRRLSPG